MVGEYVGSRGSPWESWAGYTGEQGWCRVCVCVCVGGEASIGSGL